MIKIILGLICIFVLQCSLAADGKVNILIQLTPAIFDRYISKVGDFNVYNLCKQYFEHQYPSAEISEMAECELYFNKGRYNIKGGIYISGEGIPLKQKFKIKMTGKMEDVTLDGSVYISTDFKIKMRNNRRLLVARLPYYISESKADHSPRGYYHALSAVGTELMVDDKIVRYAQWPEIGYVYLEKSGEYGYKISESKKNSAAIIKITETNAPNYIQGFWEGDWGDELVKANFSSEKNMYFPSGAKPNWKNKIRARFYGSIDYFDKEEAYFFDKKNGSIYLLCNHCDTERISLTSVENILVISNYQNVYIEGLKMLGARGNGVEIYNSNNITIRGAKFSSLGSLGVDVHNSNNVFLIDNVYDGLGEGGVYVNAGDRRSLSPGNVVVEGSSFTDFSRLAYSYRPAIRLEGVGNVAANNYIKNAPHSALIYSGNDHLIIGNIIDSACSDSADMGAIYTGRDWTARGNIVAFNTIRNVKKRYGDGMVVGVYLDDQASGSLIYGNKFDEIQVPILIGGGRDNIVDGNYISNSEASLYIDSRGVDWQKEKTHDPSYPLLKKYMEFVSGSDLYGSRYKNLANLINDDLGAPKYNVFKNNCLRESPPPNIKGSASNGIVIYENYCDREIDTLMNHSSDIKSSDFEYLTKYKEIYNKINEMVLHDLQ